jgi:hypothetical protein
MGINDVTGSTEFKGQCQWLKTSLSSNELINVFRHFEAQHQNHNSEILRTTTTTSLLR